MPGEAAAPTNGASGVQAPKAPVAPTPKNGEGAVVPSKAPAAATPNPAEAPGKQEWRPVKLKLPVKDGDPEDVEFASEEDAVRTAIRAKQFDRANKEKLALERRFEDLKARAAKGDPSALKELGYDPDAAFTKRLEEEARRAGLSENDRAIDDARRDAAQHKARAEAFERQFRVQQEEQAEGRAWSELEPRLKASIEKHGMMADSHAMETISAVAQEFIDAGLDVPPEQVVAEAAAREKARFDARLSGLTVEQAPALWKRLGPELRKELLAIGVREWKEAKGKPTSAPAKAPTPKPAAPKEYLTPYEYARRRREGG